VTPLRRPVDPDDTPDARSRYSARMSGTGEQPNEGEAGFVFAQRVPPARLGVAVVSDLVEAVVTGQVQPGELLPPEGPLAEQFGVSRTVIRESIKRLEEKGLVTVAQGRGTQVTPFGAWNVLDPVVLSALIDNDDSLGVLDELSEVRSSLEASMAGTVAANRTAEQLSRLEQSLDVMRSSEHDSDSFRQADVLFHFTVMELSANRLAENIAKILFKRALESSRYQGVDPKDAFALTIAEHIAVLEAIRAKDVPAAQASMRAHIERAWERRRLPNHKPAKQR
jgi:DNA-binding FadR family transcriptional regulator